MRSPWVFAFVSIGLSGACAGGVSGEHPNVLLISIDTLRSDHLGCYGYERATAPSIDRLAQEGVLFENHISSSSWTLPAHASMFTGLSDSVHGCLDAQGTALAPAFTTLAEYFGRGGYDTAGFFAGPYLDPAFGLGQGFDLYQNCTSYQELTRNVPREDWAVGKDVMQASHKDITNERVYGAVRSWFDGRRQTRARAPFFAFVHMWDVHFDFTPPAPYDTMFDPDYEGDITGENFFFDPRIDASLPERDKEHLLALYDGEIRWTDTFVGRLLADLEEAGLSDDTVVVVTSDHGTEFFEHGAKAHRTTLFDELIHIPLVIRFPKALPAGRRVSAQTRMIDLVPTLLELCGLPPAEGAMGKSLVPLARGQVTDLGEPAISELHSMGRDLRSVRSDSAKRIDNLVRGSQVWYDLATDPGEHSALRPPDPGGEGARIAAEFDEAVDRLEQAVEERPAAAVSPDVSPEVERQLEALGYTGQDDGDE